MHTCPTCGGRLESEAAPTPISGRGGSRLDVWCEDCSAEYDYSHENDELVFVLFQDTDTVVDRLKELSTELR